jgi:hypothetical protein
MPKRQRLGWYSFYKKSVDTLRAVTHNPPPINAKPPVKLPCGGLYFDLSQPERAQEHAPILRSRLGQLKSDEEIQEMRGLYKKDPNRWSIHALSMKFNTTRSFVINRILPIEERERIERDNEERFLKLPMDKVRGALLSARIRQVRESIN